MAGNKMNTKTKGKDERGKGTKNGGQPNEENDDLDYAMLRKPIQTSVTGFSQARKIFDLATEELKDLITNDCDLLYECKVCRNIFRSLVNFISHKRVYCKEKFNSSTHGHFIKNTSVVNEYIKIKRMEEGYQESLKVKDEIVNTEIENAGDRIPLTKDLTEVLENVTKSRGVYEGFLDEVQQVTLQKIPSSSAAVFQSMNSNEDSQDFIRSQVREIDDILSHNKAVLQSDGKFTIERSNEPPSQESEGVIQISDDEEGEDGDLLKCKICNLQFSTMKTLKFHTKYKHLESRLVYPCPDCVDIFSTSWSVYRHLFKVHRKTAAQIRRLRESIQAKAFRMNNPPAFYEKRKNNLKSATDKKISAEEKLDQENQAWMDNMESDGSAPRCGGCGRSFERRAALAAHTHTCQPRSRALAQRQTREKKIEIQIRKDYNKGPSNTIMAKNTDNNGNKVPQDENARTSFKTQKDTDKIELEEATMFVDIEDEASNDKQSALESPEKSNDSTPETPSYKPAYIDQADQSNLSALRVKMALNKSDVDIDELHCKICGITKVSTPELAEHMAINHYKWMRYACKLCHFKNYHIDKVTEHVKTVHKLKGDNDFYYSTVKVLSGAEAEEVCEKTEEAMEDNEISPSSRRPSRCSSDSSRLSDDSTSSARIEGFSRKRRLNQSKANAKKRREVAANDRDETDDQMNADTVLVENETTISNVKTFEENSSDLDDVDERLAKRMTVENAPRSRPVRKRTKPKNEDFEYDLSNLLKMEAQGYRESQGITSSKTVQTKKKPQPEPPQTNNDINKDFFGALLTMSKKSVENSAALIKPCSMSIFNTNRKEHRLERLSYPFVKPLLPKSQAKAEKISPKKEIVEEKDMSFVKTITKTYASNINITNTTSNTTNSVVTRSLIKPNITEPKKQINAKEIPAATINNEKETPKLTDNPKMSLIPELITPKAVIESPKVSETLEVNDIHKVLKTLEVSDIHEVVETPKVVKTLEVSDIHEVVETPKVVKTLEVSDIPKVVKTPKELGIPKESERAKVSDFPIVSETPKAIETLQVSETTKANTPKTSEITKADYIPTVVPIKFRRQSIELMNNPIINKNITELSKAGMKTKILLIKPIHRNKDGTQTVRSAIKYQTIKLKDPTKGSTETTFDQVKVVKIPKDINISKTRLLNDAQEVQTQKDENAAETPPITNENDDKNRDPSNETNFNTDEANNGDESESNTDSKVITIDSSPKSEINSDDANETERHKINQ